VQRTEADNEALTGIRDLVDPQVADAYELLLGNRPAGRAIPDPDVRRALAEYGMAHPQPGDQLVMCAADPVSALETVIHRRQLHNLAQQERLAAAQRSAVQLRRKAWHSRFESPQTVVKPENATALAATMIELAADEYLTVHTGRPHLPAGPVSGLNTGNLRHRAIYETGFLAGQAGTRALSAAVSAGCRIRTLARPGIDLRIADHSYALLPLGSPTSDNWLYSRSPALVTGLRQYFDLLWEQAIPLDEQQPEADDRNRTIAVLLSHGLKDEAIARQLNLTLRTVRRRIGAIQAQLDVTSRFAAGAAAQRRGWLTSGRAADQQQQRTVP
jgi:DNA-binding CsgD family transcriptional regulator